jgi:hypothetical protein
VAGFPDEQLELIAQIAPGADLTTDPSTWTWVDLTCPHPSNPAQTIYRLISDSITIQRGTAVGASNSQTTSATIQLLNADGAFTPELPTSPYWPYVDAGTPIRLRMRTRTTPYATDTFTRTISNGWGTTTTGGYTWTPGTASQYNTTGSTGTITFPTRADSSKANKLNLSVLNPDITFDATVNAVQTGTGSYLGLSLREIAGQQYISPVLEFTTSGTIRCDLYEYDGTTLGLVGFATQPGLTYTAGTVIRARCQLSGDRMRMKAWLASGTEPAAWAFDLRVKAALAGDQTGIRSTVFTANTNTLPVVFTVDNLTINQAPMDRVEGYIADIRPSFVPQPGGTTWSTALVDIAGVGSRLEKNQSPEYSPMRRSIQLSNPAPIAYWPCEDPEKSITVASAFPEQQPMQVTGPAVFATTLSNPSSVYYPYLSRWGSKPLVSLAAGAKLAGTVPATTVNNEWAVSCDADFDVAGIPLTSMRVLQWDTPSSAINRWALVATATTYLVRAYNDSLGTTTDLAVATISFNGEATFSVEADQNGANIDVKLRINDVGVANGSLAGTLAAVTRVYANPDRVNTTASVDPYGIRFLVGHIRVLTDTSVNDLPIYTDPDTGDELNADGAWYGETAHRRINRLCAEEDVPFQWVGNPQGSGLTILNAQRDGTFTDLITQAAESESGGLLYEKRFGYEYLPRAARYNRAVALTIDMAAYKRSDGTDQASVLVPQLDRRATNYWTVTRNLGSSASYAAPLALRKRRGTIAEEATVDVLTDDLLPAHAAWRTHLSVDAQGANYPAIPVDLGANPELIEKWLGCDIGSRVQRVNQPTIAGIGVIDQVIEGITETITPTSWQVTLAASPGSVWDVGVYDDPGSRYDSASTTLAGTPPSTTSTAWTVSTANPADVWSTTATPYDWAVAGEQVTVTVMGAATGTGPYVQTCTVVRAVNGVVKAHTVGEQVSLAHPARYAL